MLEMEFIWPNVTDYSKVLCKYYVNVYTNLYLVFDTFRYIYQDVGMLYVIIFSPKPIFH